ncbi:MAG TPA: hypothetical protein VNO33_02325 [Kofleriaceae bacterium]|nr:hypothetical protein [Kofleriaceae bacterium]
MTKFIMAAAAGLAITTGLAGAAEAKLCNRVGIHVYNDYEDDGVPIQIRIVDFDYWDDEQGRWREENWVGNTVFLPGEDKHPFSDRNLEYVGDESGVVIRIQFQYMTANNGWSETLNAESAEFTCNDDDHVNVHVD